jgi:hypothetical protein
MAKTKLRQCTNHPATEKSSAWRLIGRAHNFPKTYF